MNAPVAVLFDDTPGSPSNNVYSQLDQTKVIPLTARTPSDLTKVSLPAGVNGFMLLPNAMFFNHCDDVVKIVDGKTLAGGGPGHCRSTIRSASIRRRISTKTGSRFSVTTFRLLIAWQQPSWIVF
jgi:hypothetical protein